MPQYAHIISSCMHELSIYLHNQSLLSAHVCRRMFNMDLDDSKCAKSTRDLADSLMKLVEWIDDSGIESLSGRSRTDHLTAAVCLRHQLTRSTDRCTQRLTDTQKQTQTGKQAKTQSTRISVTFILRCFAGDNNTLSTTPHYTFLVTRAATWSSIVTNLTSHARTSNSKSDSDLDCSAATSPQIWTAAFSDAATKLSPYVQSMSMSIKTF